MLFLTIALCLKTNKVRYKLVTLKVRSMLRTLRSGVGVFAEQKRLISLIWSTLKRITIGVV